MSDLIDREALLKLVPTEEIVSAMAIKAAPKVDAVEVVRCEDCIHHIDEEPGMVYCPAVIGGWVGNEFYCADGERRTE